MLPLLNGGLRGLLFGGWRGLLLRYVDGLARSVVKRLVKHPLRLLFTGGVLQLVAGSAHRDQLSLWLTLI